MSLLDHLPPLPEEPSLSEAIRLLCLAVEAGWVQDKADIGELAAHLVSGRDWSVQDASFDLIAGRLRVTFRDERVTCDVQPFVKHLVAWARASD